jgi:hypothetical protein
MRKGSGRSARMTMLSAEFVIRVERPDPVSRTADLVYRAALAAR